MATSAGFASLVNDVFSQIKTDHLHGITLVNQRNATGSAVQQAMLERKDDSHNRWSALYFAGSTHGSPLTLGGAICRWPHATFPATQQDESQVLESVRNQCKERRSTRAPIAAVVVEPTQQSTGLSASTEFIKSLHSIASDFEAALVVDETASGCYAAGKGRFW